MKNSMYLLTPALMSGLLAACGGDVSITNTGETEQAALACREPRPEVGPCETATCDTTTGEWIIGFARPGASCPGSTCDGAGSCLPTDPPSADYTMNVMPIDTVTAVNNQGIAVGTFEGNIAYYALGMSAAVKLPVSPRYSQLLAMDIADNNIVVGVGVRYDPTSGDRAVGLYWPDLTATPIEILPPPGILADTVPTAVNSQGDVVGYYEYTLSHAFKWCASTGTVTLNESVPVVNSLRSKALDISETGLIAGWISGDVYSNVSMARWSVANNSLRLIPSTHDLLYAATRWQVSMLSNGGVTDGATPSGPTFWSASSVPVTLVPDPNVSIARMSSNGRLIGASFNGPAVEEDSPVPLTMESPNAPITHLPIPVIANGSAEDVNACGTIVGNLLLERSTPLTVMWTRPNCDPQAKVVVPDVRGTSLPEAVSILHQAGLFPGNTSSAGGSCDTAGAGPLVAIQSPLGDTLALPGSAVNMGCGVAVPALGGLTAAGARATLEDAGLLIGSTLFAIDDSCDFIGFVMRQSPAADVYVDLGSRVNITIGKRPKFCQF